MSSGGVGVQSTGAFQVKNSAQYGGEGERLVVVVSGGEKKIEIRKRKLEEQDQPRQDVRACDTPTVSIPAPASDLTHNGTETLRVTVPTVSGLGGDISVTMISATDDLKSDDSPMEDDDQHNEEQFVAQIILQWMKCQKMSAEEMTHRQLFESKEMQMMALKIARALDQQHADAGVESMAHSSKWNGLAVDLLALYNIGNKTWMLGTDLWGPGGKGMVREMMLTTVRGMRSAGTYAFGDLTIQIPKQRHSTSNKRKLDQVTEDGSPRSPGRHHRNQTYRLFGRGPRVTNKAGELVNPEAEIADVQDTNAEQQRELSEGGKKIDDSIPEIPKGGVPTKHSVSDIPDGSETHRRSSSKRKQLSLSKAKAAKQKPDTKPSNLGSTENPIDLETYNTDDFPILNIQTVDLRNNRARAMWKLQSRTRQRNHREVDTIQWNGNPTDLPADLAIVATASINGKHQDVTFDTAAMVTCMSKAVWVQIGSPPVTAVESNVCGADGTKLNLVGAIRVSLTLGERTFPYRAWVIDGLQSDILLGLDFISHYKIDLMFSSLKAQCGDHSIPLRLEGWGRKKMRQMNAKIKVVATQTLLIPPEHERNIPVETSSRIPKEWTGRNMLFVPSGVWRGYEVASFITVADNSGFTVLTKNLNRSHEACIEAGMILGHFEVLGAECDVRALKVQPPGQPDEPSNHDSTEKTTTGDAVSAVSDKTAKHQVDEIAKIVENLKEKKRRLSETDDGQKDGGEGMNIETSKGVPRGVPGDTASPTSPRQDPASLTR